MTKCTNRRAISSIIGSAVFLVLFIAGFTVFMSAIQVSSDRFSEQLSTSFDDSLRDRENFSIAPSTDTVPIFYVQVFNQGSVPINVVDVFLTRDSDGTFTEYNVDFQDAHVAPNQSKAIFENHPDSPIPVFPGTYSVKVITELGTMVTAKLITPLNPLFADIFTIPKNPGSGQNVTVSLIIYNRGNATVFNVQPVRDAGPGIDPMTNPDTAIKEVIGPIPPSINSLEPGESVQFNWQFQLFGAIGTQIAFTNAGEGTDGASGDTVTSDFVTTSIQFVPQAISLIQRPEIKVLIPNPAGEDTTQGGTAKALWGLNVINPSSFIFEVSRVVFVATPNTPDIAVFDSQGAGCQPEIHSPPTGNWSCPGENILQWIDVVNPIPIPPKGMQSFYVNVNPAKIAGNLNDPATNIFVTVFSSYGPATQLAIPTGTYQGSGGTIVEIFVTNTDDTTEIIDTSGSPDSLNLDTVLGNLQGIPSGSTFTLNMTVGVFGSENNSGIAVGRMIINIPSGFAVGTIVDVDNAFSATILEDLEFTDGSKQIRDSFTNVIGAGSTIETVTVRIPLTAPIVTTNATYTIIGIVEGITETNFEPIGPLVEFPIRIIDVKCGNPITTCPPVS